MKLKTGIFIIFLAIGLLGVPNCIFAQSYGSSASDVVLQNNLPATMHLSAINPEVKGGGGGGRGGSFSGSKSSSSKKIKSGDDDLNDTDDSDDGSGWFIALMIIVVLGIIGILVWYYFLRK